VPADLPEHVEQTVHLIAKLHADEILPARAGIAYPLGEAEMQWHLSYFGLVKRDA